MKTNVIGLLLTLSMAAQAKVIYTSPDGWTYLGNAYNRTHCSQIAGSYGFNTYTYGGWVNGYPVQNACFGKNKTSTNPSHPSSCDVERIRIASWSLGSATRHLTIRMNLSTQKPTYSGVHLFADRFEADVQELEDSAKDGSSCRYLREFFLDVVRPAYEQLEREFLAAQRKAMDSQVLDYWWKLEKKYRELRSKM